MAQTHLGRQFPSDIRLPAKARGDDAIRELGARLPEVAAFYGKTPAELQKLFREDHSIWADTRGRLFYVCEIQVPSEETVTGNGIGTTDPAPFSPEQTFHLHGRPGAGKVIYLDFDGHDASTTSWGADAIGRPFDTDGNPYTFSATERDRIVYIWQRVCEDYAMYDIDVTTEDPGPAALIKSSTGDTNYGIRVVIAGSSSDWYGSAGGVAYVGSFDDNTDLPCWVFPKSLGPDNEKYIAEAISHEVGHTLGLSHDGRTSPVESYYQGQGNWAPIMGVGYYKPIVQWSKGEYANANQTQDDLAVMLTYGAVYRTDDHGNSTGTATPLTGVVFSTNGVISQRTDLDYFGFTTGDGRVTINVNRAPRDANLRLQVTLYNAAGVSLLVTNVADTTGGTQPVILTTTLAAGNYYFSVDGIGSNDPVTDGYSDYASLGQYAVTGTLPTDSAWLPTAAGTTYQWSNPANWASNTLPNGVGATLRVNNNIAGDQTITLAGSVTLGRLFLGDANSTHAFTIQSGGAALQFNNLAGPAVLNQITGANNFIAAPITLAGDLVVTNTTSGTLTLNGGISGSGSLAKYGSGTLILGGVLTYTNGTTIGGGTLALDATASFAGSVDIKTGAIFDSSLAGGLVLGTGANLSGQGVVIGDTALNSGASLLPGGVGTAGTLTFSNQLTLNNGTTLHCDLAATETTGGGTNDLINVGGDLTLSGTVTVDPAFLATGPVSPGVYTLIRYGGILTGGVANLAIVNDTNRYSFTFDDTVPGEIRLLVSGTPSALVWAGDGLTNSWDLTAPTNWLDGLTPESFRQLDSVTFTDTGSLSPAITLAGSLTPLSVTVNAAGNYTFTGSGKISGTASLTKQGAGTLTVATSNDFDGPVIVAAGTLKAGHAAALGSTNAGTTVANGATLDVNALNLGAENLIVAGSGVNGAGAVLNSSPGAAVNALRFVTLAGPTTLGGVGRWDIRANPTASLAGNNFTLTKTGTNEIWLVDLGNTALGDINVAQGTLGIQDSTTLGSANSNLTVAAAATLAFWNTDVNVLSKQLVLNGGILNSAAGDNVFSGKATLNANVTMTVAAGLQLQGIIGGAGGIVKTGPGTLSLTAANTFTGAVTVSTGTLRTGNAAALGSTNSGTTISSDARLDIAGSNLGAEPITVTGDGLGNAGAIVNYGSSQQNALRFVTLSGNTTFGGISRWDLRANPTGWLAGGNKTLTKRGPNEVWLVNLGDTALGAITVAEGTLGFQGTTTLGSPASNITVNAGCTLGIYATGTNLLAKNLTLSSGLISNASGTNSFVGPCAMTGSNAFLIATSTSLNLSGVLSGAGALWSLSGGTLVLTGNNTYSGATVIKAGTLVVTGLTGTNFLVVSNGAALRGTGTVRGATTVNGLFAPGTAAIGILNVSNTLTLAGSTTMRIAKNPGPVNDQVRGISTVSYGGTLTVTNAGGTLSAGDVFQLFSAANRIGSFAPLNLPVLSPGLMWSNRLVLDGSLLVVPVPSPQITSTTLNGSSLKMQISTESGVTYVLQRTDSLLAPVIWTSISTNAGTGGSLLFSPTVNFSRPGEYFRVLAY